MTEQEIIQIVQTWLNNNFQKTKVSQLATASSLTGLYVLGFMANGSVKAPIELLKGNAGKSVELRNNNGEMQWRVEGGTWAKLYDQDDLRGKPFTYEDFTQEQLDLLSESVGDGLEFRANTTHIQYRLKGGTWIDVVALELLKGDKGDAFKYSDFTQSQLDSLKVKGDTGANIELQKSTTHVQWRVQGTTTWTNLIPLADLKGAKGDAPIKGIDYFDGNTPQKGVDYFDGADGKNPVVIIGTITTVASNTQADATIEPDGVDAEGKPKFKLNLWLPKGVDGEGAGDMLKSIYDPTGKNADIFGYVDEKVKTDVPENAKFTDTTYSEITEAEIDAGTSATPRTISARRVKHISDKSSNELSGHNTSPTSHTDIRTEVAAVRLIAEGASKGYVFDTKADLDAWLLVQENVNKLKLGNIFFIRAVNIPDYWWDGTEALEVEAGKVDLTGYMLIETAMDTFVAKEENKSLVDNTEIAKLLTVSAGAQKNSDITKAEIEAKLTGYINTHEHKYGTYKWQYNELTDSLDLIKTV